MLLLVSTQIEGQERKKKLQTPDTVTAAQLNVLVSEAFSAERSLGSLERLDIFDEEFGEYIDMDGTAVQDKAKLRAVFKSTHVQPAAADHEKDRVIEQLRTRLVQLEGNIRILSTKASAADRSETHSQKSATSDLRKKKCEEKHMNSDASVCHNNLELK